MWEKCLNWFMPHWLSYYFKWKYQMCTLIVWRSDVVLAQLKNMLTISIFPRSYNRYTPSAKHMKPNETKRNERSKKKTPSKHINSYELVYIHVCVCEFVCETNMKPGESPIRFSFHSVRNVCSITYLLRINVKRLPNVHCSDVILHFQFVAFFFGCLVWRRS